MTEIRIAAAFGSLVDRDRDREPPGGRDLTYAVSDQQRDDSAAGDPGQLHDPHDNTLC